MLAILALGGGLWAYHRGTGRPDRPGHRPGAAAGDHPAGAAVPGDRRAGTASHGDDPTWAFFEVAGTRYKVRRTELARRGERAVRRSLFLDRLRSMTRHGDPEPADCLALARWVGGHGLPGPHALALRWALMLDPESREARRLLARHRSRYARLPADPGAEERLRSEMGRQFRIHRTGHFRIAHESTAPLARRTGRLLERVYQAYMAFFRDRYFEPLPPSDRLEVALFATRAGYRRFTARFGPVVSGAGGVYSSADHRSYFFDALGDEDLADAGERLSRARARLEELDRDVSRQAGEGVTFHMEDEDGIREGLTEREARRVIQMHRARLNRAKQRLDGAYRRLNVSRAVHEIVHHLGYATGVHSRYHANPRWVVEGLALYFDPSPGGRWEGPGRIHAQRLSRFKERLGGGRWTGIDALTRDDTLFETGGAKTAEAYDAAWALFHFLATEHHDALFDYLANLSLRVSEKPDPPRERIREVTRAFGPLRDLERRWLRYVERL